MTKIFYWLGCATGYLEQWFLLKSENLRKATKQGAMNGRQRALPKRDYTHLKAALTSINKR